MKGICFIPDPPVAQWSEPECSDQKFLQQSTQKTDHEMPSSQITTKENLLGHCSNFIKTCKSEPKLFDIDRIQDNEQYENCIEGECSTKKEEDIQKKIKKEDVSEGEQEWHESKKNDPLKKSKKWNNRMEVSNFYQQEMQDLIKHSSYEKDDSIISWGTCDYKRTSFSQTIKPDEKMGIEVLNDNLMHFDPSLVIPNSLRHPSRNRERRLFQIMIKEESCHLKSSIFSHFVRLSLGEIVEDNNTYLSWKKSILEKLSMRSSHLKEKIFANAPKKDFGRIKGFISFEKNYLYIYEKILAKETMHHALFSIFIEIDGKLENILISRAGMGYFLNKYSDCFLKELINYKGGEIFTKKMGCSYFAWKKLKKNILIKIIDKARPKFEHLFKSDHDIIRKKVLVLKKTGFRALRDDEFHGLTHFIGRLVDFEGYSGIVERACRHFYKGEYHKRHPPKNIESMEKQESNLSENESTGSVLKIEEKKPIVKTKSKRIEEEIDGKKDKERKMNCFRIAQNYQKLMCYFIEKNKIVDNYLISNGPYDYKRLQYDITRSMESRKKIGIEFTEDCFLSFDPMLVKDSFNRNPFSRKPDKRDFQKILRERVYKKLKEAVFLRFVDMSLPDKLGKEKESYISWRESILEEAYSSSLAISENLSKKYQIKDIKSFIGRHPISYAKSLIRETIRHALFSIPTEDGNFLISRAGLSRFLNKYSSHFFLALTEYEGINESFIKGRYSSCISWKRSKSAEIYKIMAPCKRLFVEMLETDCSDIHKDVLIFDKSEFRAMTHDEFQILIQFIHQLVECDSIDGFIERAIRFFYNKKII